VSRGWDKSEKVFSLDRGEEKNEGRMGKEEGKTDEGKPKVKGAVYP